MLFSRQDGPAQLIYAPNEFRVVKPGKFVFCAVTEAEIPLEALRYWSVGEQEAYATAEAATERLNGNAP